MPLYNVITQAGTLNDDAKAKLANALTTLHSDYASVPKNWVHVVFQDYPPGSGFTGGQADATASLVVTIRNGRTADYKRGLLTRLWALLQEATGASDEQIVMAIQEV